MDLENENEPNTLLTFGSPALRSVLGSKMMTELQRERESSSMGTADAYDREMASVLGQLLLDQCDAKDATAALEMMAQRQSQELK